MKTPDITPAQITAAVGWVVAQALAFGWVSDSQAQLLISIGATVLATAWKFADAHLRGKRAEAQGAIQAAAAIAPTGIAPATDQAPAT